MTEKGHALLIEKLDKEMDEFRASYKNFDVQQTYNDWYIIGFYEEHYDMLTCGCLDNQGVEKELEWLASKDKALEFLYDAWMDADGAFSHKWDDMLDFIREIYREELIEQKHSNVNELISNAKQTCEEMNKGIEPKSDIELGRE